MSSEFSRHGLRVELTGRTVLADAPQTRWSVRRFQQRFAHRDGGCERLHALVFARSPPFPGVCQNEKMRADFGAALFVLRSIGNTWPELPLTEVSVPRPTSLQCVKSQALIPMTAWSRSCASRRRNCGRLPRSWSSRKPRCYWNPVARFPYENRYRARQELSVCHNKLNWLVCRSSSTRPVQAYRA